MGIRKQPVKTSRMALRTVGEAVPALPGLRRSRAAATVSATADNAERQAMRPLIELIVYIIDLYKWIVIAQVIMSWLVAFGVINTHNRLVAQIGEVLYRLTEPALRPIRRVIPDLGGIDISPIVLLLLLWLVQREIVEYLLF
jgi:YggT family protein